MIREGDQVELGTKVQLRWQSDRPLYVYAWNDELSTSWALFPDSRSTWTNPLPADHTLLLPSAQV